MGEIEVGSIVGVWWIDIVHEEDINEYEAKKLEPIEAVSYGELLVNNDEKVIIIETKFIDGEKRGVLCIPKCVVKSIKLYEEAKNV